MDKEKLYTIKELEDRGLGNRVSQWRWRKKHIIGYYEIAGKIYYGEKHLAAFLARCERPANAEKQMA